MCDPSGDHVGNPKVPSATPARTVDSPAASMITREPSRSRTAIDPDDAIRPRLAAAVGAALAIAGEGFAVAIDGVTDAGLPEGAGPPHAAARTTIAAVTVCARNPRGAIT